MIKAQNGTESGGLISLLRKYPLSHAIGRVITRFYREISWAIAKRHIAFNPDGLNRTEERDRKIIVSLTSYPGRIKVVPYVIAPMLNQTMKPDKIILWLGEKEFSERKLPRIFEKLQDYGVEVQFREDIGPHTKYFYAVQEYPDDIIITIDDDVLYGSAVVESLYRSWEKHPDCISSSGIYKMTFDIHGMPLKYNEWDADYFDPHGLESHQYIALGVSGVLYPPQSLPKETFNIPALKKYSFHNDDIWLKFMEVINDTRVVHAPNKSKTPNRIIPVSQTTALWKTNILAGKTDQDISAMIGAYNDWFGDGRKLTDIMREG